MRKLKIFITIFVLYEFVMLSVLQIPTYCNAIFNYNFCAMYNFKYFLLCLMLPVLCGLVIWWTPEFARMLCPNKCACDKAPQTIHDKDMYHDEMSKQYLEKLITSAIMIGVQKFATSHPKTEKVFDNIFDALTTPKKTKKKK